MMPEFSTLIASTLVLYLVRDKHSVNNTGETCCAYSEFDDPQGHMKR